MDSCNIHCMEAMTGFEFFDTINSVVLVRERTVPTEQPPPVGEVSANFTIKFINPKFNST